MTGRYPLSRNTNSPRPALCLPSSVICLLIWLYRHSLSYFLGRNCRFMPTCSAYAEEAVRLHGPVTGAQLAFRRLCRCHPFTFLGSGHGYDPVPEKHSGENRQEKE